MPPLLLTYAGAFLARCIAMLGPFGTAVITARMLGPEDRGRYYYVLTLATIGAQLASLGIHASNSYLISKQPELLPRIIANTAWIAVIGGLTAAGGVVVFDLLVGEAMPRPSLAAFVIMLCPLTLLFLYLSNIAVAIERPGLFNGLIILNSFASLAAALATAYLAPALEPFLIAVVVTGILTCALAWIFVAGGSAVPWSFDRALFIQGIAFAARAHVAGLTGFFMMRTGVLILRHEEAFSDVGHWSIAAQIVEALLILPATVSLLLFPALVRAGHADRWTEYISMTVRVGATMAIVCLVVAVFARPAIVFVFGAAYEPAVGIMLALLPGVLFLSITSVVSQFLSAFGIPWMQVAAWLVCWGAQIVLSLLLLKPYGALGLAWAQSACAGLVCVWLSIMASRYSPKRLRPL